MILKRGFKLTEIGPVPEDWAVVPVGTLASRAPNAIVGGPFGSDLVSKDYVDDGVPVIRGQNLNAKYVCGLFAFVTEKKADALGANLARGGDIVFTQRGSLGQVSIVPDRPYRRYVVSQSQMKVTFDTARCDPSYIYEVFSSAKMQDFIRKNAIQTGVPHINLGILRRILVPVPSMSEQRAIAAALGQLDDLLANYEKLIAKKRLLKQAAMQDLLTGKCRLPGFGKENWTQKKLGSMTWPRSERISPQSLQETVFCVELEDIEQGSGRLLRERVSDPGSSIKTVFRAGDVLFGKLRAYLRKFWYASRDGVCSTEIWALANDPIVITSDFLFQLVQQDAFVESASTAYGTHMPRSDWRIVGNLVVDLPPIAEQSAISAVLSNMDAEIEALRALLEKTRLLKQGMVQELLTGRIRLK